MSESKRDETDKSDFDEVIYEFASIKARKVLFQVTLCCLNTKRLAILMFRWNCVILTQVIHVMH